MNRFLARSQRFPSVGSTNDVVRDWLADGIPEVEIISMFTPASARTPNIRAA